jgi:cellulose biosynthesis protein BcsQ
MKHGRREDARMRTSVGSAAVIVFAHWKGGVGKSTLSTQVASALGGVLIDLEPWGAATTWWAGSHATALWQSVDGSPVLRAIASGKAPRPRRGDAGRPWLVPSHEELLSLGHGQSNTAAATSAWAWTAEGQPALMVPTHRGPRQLAHALAEALAEWAKEWSSPVVVDTPAGFSPLGDGAIAAADTLVVPVTLDQWAVPALVKFMAAYEGRIRAGLVVPNRLRSNRISDERWSDHLEAEGVIRPPFVLGPPVVESELLHTAYRPLRSGPTPGAAREDVIHQVELVAEAALQLATRERGPRCAVG